MAGLIKDEDIQIVRERARIDEVIEQYVTLRNAGAGSRKGLCPFHDEKSPSFNVRPSLGSYYCFGCGASGDVFKFLQEIEGLGFVEAVERLANKYGIQLRYEEGNDRGPRRDPRQRGRLIESHKYAAEFYAEALSSSADAKAGRQFVSDRGFDQAAAEIFGMGFAPRGGEALVAHLRGKGFTEDELTVGGLASRGSRGLYDRFRGRLMWPIREMTGDVIGFGARRIFDDDRIEAKYLNTSESPIYKKSQVLYGIDLARRDISSSSQAVVVEGYTDVMACHQSGVKTAVATCGTAFGEDHARILRRILLDHDAFHGEVIFTFDGDEAGQRAAMKAFSGDQQFVAQTYVAVEPRGMDPCDLRLADGDAAVRELVATRIPLYRFVLDNTLQKFDLDRGDQRIDAIRESVALATSIRDKSKVEEFIREIANRVGA
ncbi:MAG: DNA primase, partial [Aeromicrobium sp.]